MSAKKSLRDRVSVAMGQYLLRGYALLDDYCNECKDPLMRDKKGALICVRCNMLEEDEKQKGAFIDTTGVPPPITVKEELTIRNNNLPLGASGDKKNSTNGDAIGNAFGVTIAVIEQKIQWASEQLKHCTSAQDCIQFCSLIQSCVETIQKLKEL